LPGLEELFRVIMVIRKSERFIPNHVHANILQRDNFCIAASVNWV
jgi:hypothetical protein